MPHYDVDGLALNVDRYGMGPPVVLLHGFTGSRTSWYDIVRAIEGEFTTLSVDLIGHGWSGSPPTVERYQMSRAVTDLVALVRQIGFEKAIWVGYSLGGRTALQLAIQHPDAVSALVLEGASPGLPTEKERAERIAAAEALAQKAENEGLEAFIDYWQSIPLWDSQKTTLTEPQRIALRQQRLAQRDSGHDRVQAQPAVGDDLARQRVAIGVQPRRGQAQHPVARHDALARHQPGLLDHRDAEAGQLVLALGIEARKLGGFAAN